MHQRLVQAFVNSQHIPMMINAVKFLTWFQIKNQRACVLSKISRDTI